MASTPPVAYKAILVQFMSFVDSMMYSVTDDTTIFFSRDRLSQITADDVARYLNYKAYGNPEPAAEELPTRCRSNITRRLCLHLCQDRT